MEKKQIYTWLLLICFALSCALFVWAWLCAIYLLFFGIAAVPAFFLQGLIRCGGKEWKWLLIVHAIILACTAGVGGLIILLTENMAQLYGMLLAAIAGSALVGCLIEWMLSKMWKGKDEKIET